MIRGPSGRPKKTKTSAHPGSHLPKRAPQTAPIAVPELPPKRNGRWEQRTTGGRGMDHLLIRIRPTSRRRAGASGGDTGANKSRHGRRTKTPRSQIEGAIGAQVGVPDGRRQGRSRIPREEKCQGPTRGGEIARINGSRSQRRNRRTPHR
jgi:hypothetical protein